MNTKRAFFFGLYLYFILKQGSPGHSLVDLTPGTRAFKHGLRIIRAVPPLAFLTNSSPSFLMDPVSVFGIVTGGVQVIQFITEILKGLTTLRGKFQNADLTIHSLISELTTIKSAIIQLRDWADYDSRNSPENADYNQDLNVALEGCRAIMEILYEEISSLTRGAAAASENKTTAALGFGTRAKVVWNDDLMRSRQEMLHAQVLALQLLLQACQCRSSSEQIELLRRAENRRIIKKVADDTCTLKSYSSSVASQADSSSRIYRQPSITETIFDFDDTVVCSFPYRQALLHSRSKSATQLHVNNGNSSTVTDEGYASGALGSVVPNLSISTENSHSHLAAPQQLAVSPHGLVVAEQSRSRSVSFKNDSSRLTTSNIRRWQSDSTPLSSGSRREKFRSAIRRLGSTASRGSLGATSPPASGTSPTQLSTRGARGRKSDFSISIDLSSPEGAWAPPMVKAAQSGSRLEVEGLIEAGHSIEARHGNSGRNALLVAAHCGNEEIVDLLIQNNARLNVADMTGSTGLHLAASRGHCNVLELLLLENVDVEVRNSDGRTPLGVATEQGQLEATRMLISFHAKINSRADNQMTALHAAAKRGDEKIVELLVSHGADMEAKDAAMMTALHYACEEGHLSVIELLLNNKVGIDVPGCDRRTPLICAAAMGKFLVVQLLLSRKASFRCVDDGGMTALHWAAFNGHVEIVDLLSRKKGSLAAMNTAGRTALHLAVKNSQFAVVELLLRKEGLSTEIRCGSGLTPLHYACTADNFEIARLLLMAGSDIEAQADNDQRRPIHLAAAGNSTRLLTLFCDKGASLDARDSMGDRALCTACRYGHAGAAQLLLDRGSPLHLRFGTRLHDDSPLCLAAKDGHVPVVTLLLQRGASVLRKDEVGWQPIRYAAYYAHPETLQLLLACSPDSTYKGIEINLSPEKIVFAPNANISDERKRQVQDILSQAHWQPPMSMAATLPQRNVSYAGSERPAAPTSSAISPPISWPSTSFETVARHGPTPVALELPSSDQQELSSCRSTTLQMSQGELDDSASLHADADAHAKVSLRGPPIDGQRTMSPPNRQHQVQTSFSGEPSNREENQVSDPSRPSSEARSTRVVAPTRASQSRSPRSNNPLFRSFYDSGPSSTSVSNSTGNQDQNQNITAKVPPTPPTADSSRAPPSQGRQPSEVEGEEADDGSDSESVSSDISAYTAPETISPGPISELATETVYELPA